MPTLFTLVTLLTLSPAARAAEVDCRGYLYGMQDHFIVTLDIDRDDEPACYVPLSALSFKEKETYCNPDDMCDFRAHVVRKQGNLSTIDRIVGGIRE
jgi:hypothetical protein